MHSSEVSALFFSQVHRSVGQAGSRLMPSVRRRATPFPEQGRLYPELHSPQPLPATSWTPARVTQRLSLLSPGVSTSRSSGGAHREGQLALLHCRGLSACTAKEITLFSGSHSTYPTVSPQFSHGLTVPLLVTLLHPQAGGRWAICALIWPDPTMWGRRQLGRGWSQGPLSTGV